MASSRITRTQRKLPHLELSSCSDAGSSCKLLSVPLIKLKFYDGRQEPLKRAFDWCIAIPTLILVRQSLLAGQLAYIAVLHWIQTPEVRGSIPGYPARNIKAYCWELLPPQWWPSLMWYECTMGHILSIALRCWFQDRSLISSDKHSPHSRKSSDLIWQAGVGRFTSRGCATGSRLLG